MKRVLLALLVLALAGGLAACQSDAHEEQRATMDNAIHEIEHVILGYYQLDAGASGDDIQSVTDKLSAPWDEMMQAADGLEDIDLGEVTVAHEELISAVEAVAEDGEDSQAVQSVIPKVDAFKSAIDEMHGAGHFHE